MRKDKGGIALFQITKTGSYLPQSNSDFYYSSSPVSELKSVLVFYYYIPTTTNLVA